MYSTNYSQNIFNKKKQNETEETSGKKKSYMTTYFAHHAETFNTCKSVLDWYTDIIPGKYSYIKLPSTQQYIPSTYDEKLS